MRLQCLPFTGHRAEIALHAIVLACHTGLTFNVKAFCAYAKVKPNRHTRNVLNALVEEGILAKAKLLEEDGHYRMQYFERKTKRMFS